MVGIWRKQSGGDPSKKRGSKGVETEHYLTDPPKAEASRPPTYPMDFLGCLLQKGELLASWALTAWESCLGCQSRH